MNTMEYIDGFAKFKSDGGFKPGLERVQAALNLLGNPEKQVKIIHVAGTNGKGSTSAMISSVLKHAGYRVGFYSSPHLLEFQERFRLNGKPITVEDLEVVIEKIKPVIDVIQKDSALGQPSYFELITILAFVYYAHKNVDALVLEVGLGGRLDATNVAHPVASVITSIGYDHTEYLGTTLGQIAYEKAGIIKEKTPIIVGVRHPEAYEVITQQAEIKEATLYAPLTNSTWKMTGENLRQQTLDLCIDGVTYKELALGLIGEHQVRNAVVAIQTLNVLKELFPNVNEATIRRGLREVRWPGRLELVRENPPVLLDGAHNIEGIDALAGFLQRVKEEYKNLYLVMSILKDKDFIPMIKRIVPLASGIIFTQNHSLRASTAEDLAKIVENDTIQIRVIPDFEEGIRTGLAWATEGDLVCITGSLYTISEARSLLLKEGAGDI